MTIGLTLFEGQIHLNSLYVNGNGKSNPVSAGAAAVLDNFGEFISGFKVI